MIFNFILMYLSVTEEKYSKNKKKNRNKIYLKRLSIMKNNLIRNYNLTIVG